MTGSYDTFSKMKEKDQYILNELSKKNEKPFEIFFHDLYPDLVRFAYSFVLDQGMAEDIVQEAFLYIWENSKKIRLRHTLKSYITTTVRNSCLKTLKKNYNWEFIEEIELLNYAVNDTAQIDSVEVKELRGHIKNAIKQLPEKCREIFLLSRFTGFTYRQIADKLGISVKTVEAQMNIALNRIKRYLEDNKVLISVLLFVLCCTLLVV